MAQCGDEIAYWKSIYADLQVSGVASKHSRDTISVGDLVQRRGHWYPVVRVNAKTVSVRMHAGASMDQPHRLSRDLRPPASRGAQHHHG